MFVCHRRRKAYSVALVLTRPKRLAHFTPISAALWWLCRKFDFMLSYAWVRRGEGIANWALSSRSWRARLYE